MTMDKRQLLQNLKLLELDISSKLETVSRLESLVTSAKTVMDGNSGGGGSCGCSGHSYTENIVVKYIDLKNTIAKQTEKLMDLQKQVAICICNIPDEYYKIILQELYLNYRELKDVSKELNVSDSYIIKLHTEALNKLIIPDELYKKLSRVLKKH